RYIGYVLCCRTRWRSRWMGSRARGMWTIVHQEDRNPFLILSTASPHSTSLQIGLLDGYQVDGRECDRLARRRLGQARGRSVFPAPVRCVLEALNMSPLPLGDKHQEACRRSRASAPHGKGISRQTFNILSKIREADDLLQARPELRPVVREIHPELCFY